MANRDYGPMMSIWEMSVALNHQRAAANFFANAFAIARRSSRDNSGFPGLIRDRMSGGETSK